METLKYFITQLESATSDPVIKLLVISCTVLIIVITLSVIFKAIKAMFVAIFGRKKKKVKSSAATKQEAVPQKTGEQKGPDPTTSTESKPQINNDTRTQNAQALLDTLRSTLQNHKPTDAETAVPKPMALNAATSYTAEALKDLEYRPTEEDAALIIQNLEGKNISELELALKTAQDNKKMAEVASEAKKSQYIRATNQRSELVSAEKTAIETFNQGVEAARHTIESSKQEKDSAFGNLTAASITLSNLLVSVSETAALLQQLKEELAIKTTEIEQLVTAFEETNTVSDDSTHKAIEGLKTLQSNAEQHISRRKENDNSIVQLIQNITVANSDLAIYQLTEQTITKRIQDLKFEEETRLAEQKQKEEAEARARAQEEEARRQEKERQAAEEAERLQIKEEQQKAEEARKAEEQSHLAEKATVVQADASEASQNTKEPLPEDRSQNTAPNRKLTPAEEAEQAKATLAAQRERRRKEAQRKAEQKHNGSNDPAPESNTPIVADVATETVPAHEETTQKPPAVESQPQADDPMAKIRARWAKEDKLKEALKAGDVDSALNLVDATETTDE